MNNNQDTPETIQGGCIKTQEFTPEQYSKIELRKWCVTHSHTSSGGMDLTLAQKIYDWVTEVNRRQ